MKKESDIKPIFILSTARSGTTSLSNHLCQHPEIACFQAEEHWGIHECPFIADWKYPFDDLSDEDKFLTFMKSFKESDIFRLSNVDEEVFYKEKPNNIIEVINILIREFCKKEQSKFWLNNSPRQSFYVAEMLRYYPNAYYIIIKRPIIPTVRSNIKRFENKTIYSLLKKVFRYRTDFDAINRFKGELNNVLELNFDDYIDKKEDTLREIVDFLDLNWNEKLLDNPFEIQSSFNENINKKDYFNKKDKSIIKVSNLLFRSLPFNLLEKPIRKYWDKLQAEKSSNSSFYYRLHPHSKYMNGSRFHREDSNK